MSEPCLSVVCPGRTANSRYALTLEAALRGRQVELLARVTPDQPLAGKRLLFAVPVDETGVNLGLYKLLAVLRATPGLLNGCTGGILIDGSGDLYTKAIARDLVLAANQAGCRFVGRPLVEGTGNLQNFAVQAKNGACSLEQAYQDAARDLVRRILSFAPSLQARPKLTVLHASSRTTSNTLALWGLIKERLADRCEISVIGLRNGTLEDCAGCSYTTCLHFGEKGDCFYGGVMVQAVYPTIRETDAILFLCPNYNDALAANLTACINRLTALYRTTPFAGKALFGLVVSGYSGGDIVASQLVSALCMNKGFWLPSRFCLLETANDAGTAIRLPDIGRQTADFADNLLAQLCAP